LSDQNTVEVPPGLIAVTTYGAITAESTHCLINLRGYNDSHNIKNVAYDVVSGALVDKARNEAALRMLHDTNLQWLLFLDADMSFNPDIAAHLLLTGYGQTPWADMVGGYACLKGPPYLPTIDTGSGLWEPTDAGQGPIEVIRTGGACVLIKRHVFERLEWPWFGIRNAPRALDAIAEVHGFATQRFDGQNPLTKYPEWHTLLSCARDDAQRQRLGQSPNPAAHAFASTVGEDSAFCDRVKAAGMRIVVQTNAVCGHLERRMIGPREHNEAMRKAREEQLWYVGIEP
jgi:hypothetical protein